MNVTQGRKAAAFSRKCLRPLQAATQAFVRGTSGAVTVEFVVILPVLIGLFILIASASMLLVTSSEVQQVSFELTRGSLRFYEPGIAADALCSALQSQLAPAVVETGNFLSPDRFTDIQCVMNDADTSLTVTVIYDMTDHPATRLGQLVGIDLPSFTRSSQMWL